MPMCLNAPESDLSFCPLNFRCTSHGNQHPSNAVWSLRRSTVAAGSNPWIAAPGDTELLVDLIYNSNAAVWPQVRMGMHRQIDM